MDDIVILVGPILTAVFFSEVFFIQFLLTQK